MRLPVMPPVKPMLAKAVDGGIDAIPDQAGVVFEPKWDGFRCIVFRDGDEVELGSRNERPLTRYFPEILEPLRAQLPERCVIDGELVVVTGTELDFDSLQLRLHPAESRVRKLAAELPSSFVAFDLLAIGDEDLLELPFAERRARLAEVLADVGSPVHLTPTTTDRAVAADWFTRFEGAGLDGLIAKDPTLPYVQDKRVQWKVKHKRTADCVVAGFRWHKDSKGVGSLLLGLYDDSGNLHHVGVCASFTAKFRGELVDELAPLRENALDDHPWGEWASRDGRRTRAACRAGCRAGTRRRTCRGSRCGPSGWSRSSTTRCSRAGSGAWPASSAGARTRPPSSAATTSSRRWPRPSSPTSSLRSDPRTPHYRRRRYGPPPP